MANEVNEIVLLKLYGGEMILGELEPSEVPLSTYIKTTTTLKNPRALAIVPSMTGGMKVAIGSVCEPFNVKRLKERIVIPDTQIMFQLSESEIDNELVNGYKSEVSGIKIASAAETAAMNANATGDFIL